MPLRKPREDNPLFSERCAPRNTGESGHVETQFFDDGTIERFCTQCQAGVCSITETTCLYGQGTRHSSTAQRILESRMYAIGSTVKFVEPVQLDNRMGQSKPDEQFTIVEAANDVYSLGTVSSAKHYILVSKGDSSRKVTICLIDNKADNPKLELVD